MRVKHSPAGQTKGESDFSYQLYGRLTQLGQVTDFCQSSAEGFHTEVSLKRFFFFFFLEMVNLLPVYSCADKAQYLQGVFETNFFLFYIFNPHATYTHIWKKIFCMLRIIFLFFYRLMIFPGVHKSLRGKLHRQGEWENLDCVKPQKQQGQWWLAIPVVENYNSYGKNPLSYELLQQSSMSHLAGWS